MQEANSNACAHMIVVQRLETINVRWQETLPAPPYLSRIQRLLDYGASRVSDTENGALRIEACEVVNCRQNAGNWPGLDISRLTCPLRVHDRAASSVGTRAHPRTVVRARHGASVMVLMVSMGLSHGDVLLVVIVFLGGLSFEAHCLGGKVGGFRRGLVGHLGRSYGGVRNPCADTSRYRRSWSVLGWGSTLGINV
ncbi:hypothetical protein BJ170DRAFT_632071 [Xylariales sp. AK1849]|nr:hypothetical protein BJ170DRAFT_632071 [Xylariales sp. AK1849]